MDDFYFTYVLLSSKGNKYDKGFISNLPLRFESHNNGDGVLTMYQKLFMFIFHDDCLSKQDALRREKYLKNPLW